MSARRALSSAAVGLLFVGFAALGFAQDDKTGFPVMRGPYLGQEPPGFEPVLFAPGVVSTDTAEWSTAFTPDGLELFFGVYAEGSTCILHMKSVDGRWTEPAVASFSGTYPDYDLTMSPNGNRLYFTSLRPASGAGPKIENPDIWYVDRTEQGWGDPVRLPEPINSDSRDLYPSESKDGFLYFFSSRPGGFGEYDIYRAAVEGDEFGEPANLGPAVNTEAAETDSCISPNGDYIVFTSRRDEGYGGGDLYVSFKLPDGSWTQGRNLGPAVNTEHLEFCPSVSRDGKYLFFTSRRPKIAEIPRYRNTAREALGLAPNPERADIDIYWMDARYLDRLRPTALKGDYLGQEPPGLTKRLFAPGLVSTDAPEGCLGFSSDGNHAVFRRHWRENTVVLISERKNGEWSEPDVAPFFLKPYGFGDFTFAPNELRLYFNSNRPETESGEATSSSDIWMVDYADGNWARPVRVAAPVSSALHDSYPSVSEDGTIFFFRRFDAAGGLSEILSAELVNGSYSEPVNLGGNVNTEWDEWDPAISPDGKTLIFCSKKPSGMGADDLYVSFRGAEGGWSESINLGNSVNTSGSENRPFITADGKYLVFNSDEAGSIDVYWIDMEVVRRLGP